VALKHYNLKEQNELSHIKKRKESIMKQPTKIFIVVLFTSFISVSLAQDSIKVSNHHHMNMKGHMSDQDSTKHGMMEHNNMDHKMMNQDKMNQDMNDSTKTEMMNENSIVREGVIDHQAIDKNGDGKVFQDVMDFNVISDNPGKCPICGMKLKEVTLEKAKENLIKHDFKVKE
jgi:hypothetical protein